MNTRVKKICTIGPASRDPAIMERLVDQGMNIARLNFSHGDHTAHGKDIDALKALRERRGINLGILMDLSGPKIRLGAIRDEPVSVATGQTIKLYIGTESKAGVPDEFPVNYPHLLSDVKPGKRILIDDGLVILTVSSVGRDALVCTVEHGGEMRSHKGVNFPEQKLTATAPTEKDLDDLRFGLAAGVDMVALSFVQTAEDITRLREEMEKADRIVPIIAKIERPTALEELDEILNAADAIMVARGDLGIEADISMIPIYQKKMIRACNLKGKPAITATQMLDSMIRNPTPTRAEVTDVANAVYDNTDAIMLSGETAMGAFPVEAIAMMDKIAFQVETNPLFGKPRIDRNLLPARENSEQALAASAVDIAASVGARYIVAPTITGHTARLVSNNRPDTPILAVTSSESLYYQLSLLWGVEAMLLPETESTFMGTITKIEKALLARKMVKKGEYIVVAAGMPPHKAGGTNVVKVHKIGSI
jgi:pyruvate kinase